MLLFQSTLPAWGETPFRRPPPCRAKISIHSPRMGRDVHSNVPPPRVAPNFNPLSPHGERRQGVGACPCARLISIHSPRMGRDGQHGLKFAPGAISIHSPRMGRDRSMSNASASPRHFNPLSPHGERRVRRRVFRVFKGFQSTLPAWGETYARRKGAHP